MIRVYLSNSPHDSRLSIELFVYLNSFMCVFIERATHRIPLLACFTTSQNEWLNYQTIWSASFYSVEKRTKSDKANDIAGRSQNFRE